jgi:hypothetical protein
MGLKVTFDRLDVFNERVGVLFPEDFVGLAIEPCFAAAGMFGTEGVPRLREFIQRNSGYHIVSNTGKGWVYVNRYIENAGIWLLASGDPDPDLACVITSRFWDDWAKELGMRSGAKAS